MSATSIISSSSEQYPDVDTWKQNQTNGSKQLHNPAKTTLQWVEHLREWIAIFKQCFHHLKFAVFSVEKQLMYSSHSARERHMDNIIRCLPLASIRSHMFRIIYLRAIRFNITFEYYKYCVWTGIIIWICRAYYSIS